MGSDRVDELVQLIDKRSEFVEALLSNPVQRRDLVEKVEYSRSTVNRALNRLTNAGFVEQTRNGLVATMAGELAYKSYQNHRHDLTAISEEQPEINGLPTTMNLPPRLLRHSDTTYVDGTDEYTAIEKIREVIADAEQLSALLPAPTAPGVLLVVQHQLIEENIPGDLIFESELFETVDQNFHAELRNLFHEEHVTIKTASTPPVLLLLSETQSQPTLLVALYDEHHQLTYLLLTEETAGISWGRSLLGEVTNTATERSPELLG